MSSTPIEHSPHDCPKCGNTTAGGLDDHCGWCGWRPGMIIDNATITVKKAVDGTKKRRQRRAPVKKAIDTTLSMDDVLPGIAAAARSVRKPGQVFIVVSAECVRVVNR